MVHSLFDEGQSIIHEAKTSFLHRAHIYHAYAYAYAYAHKHTSACVHVPEISLRHVKQVVKLKENVKHAIAMAIEMCTYIYIYMQYI